LIIYDLRLTIEDRRKWIGVSEYQGVGIRRSLSFMIFDLWFLIVFVPHSTTLRAGFAAWVNYAKQSQSRCPLRPLWLKSVYSSSFVVKSFSKSYKNAQSFTKIHKNSHKFVFRIGYFPFDCAQGRLKTSRCWISAFIRGFIWKNKANASLRPEILNAKS